MVNVILLTDLNDSIGFSRYAGPYRIATELRRHGFSVQVINFFAVLTVDQLKEIAKKFCDKETLWIGVSGLFKASEHNVTWRGHNGIAPTPFDSVDAFNNRMKVFRDINPNIKTVYGGYWSTLEDPAYDIDIWIRGQADRSVISLTKCLQFTSKAKLRLIDSNKMYPVTDFSNLTIDWDSTDILFPNEYLPIEVARGCRFKCSFCSYDLIGKKPGDYTKSWSSLKDELIRNYEEHNIRKYFITDDTLNDSTEKVTALHKVFTSLPFKVEFDCYARIDLIHRYPQMRDQLYEMGMKGVFFGIETFNHHAGKLIGKGLHPEKTKNTLNDCKVSWGDNVLISAGIIVGLPGESEESVLKTFDYLYEKDNPIDTADVFPLQLQDEELKKDHQMSKISLDPKKYNVQKFSYYWKNEFMDLHRAKKLAAEFYSHNRKHAYSWPGRIKNLGFTHEEIIAQSKSPGSKAFSEERKKRHQQLVKEYFTILISS